MRSDAYDAIVRGFAAGRKLHLLEIEGQCVFPIYGASGGLSSRYIAYFRAPGASLPLNGEELGIEDKHHPSVWPVEISYDMTPQEAARHIEGRIAFEEIESAKFKAIGA